MMRALFRGVLLAWIALGIACGGDDDPAAETGAEIAYADGSTVWLVDVGSGEKTELTACAPAAALTWAQTGNRLACESAPEDGSTEVEVRLVDAGGTEIASFAADVGTFQWSPDGVRYSYLDSAGGETLVKMGNEGEPEVLSIGTGESPLWLPAGRLAVYRPAEAAVPGDPEGAHLDLYTGPVAHHLHKDLRPLAAALGGQLLVAAQNYEPPGELGGPAYDAYLVNPRTDSSLRVEEVDSAPVWISPDGRRGAFLSQGEAGDISMIDFKTLGISPVEGSSLKFPGEAIPRSHVAFSEDGEDLYWLDVGDGLDVYRAAIGGAPEKLASIPDSVIGELSPDRRMVAYVRSGDQPSLWVAATDGTGAKEIGPVAGAFAWKPPLWQFTAFVDTFELKGVIREEDNPEAFGGGSVSVVPQELIVRAHAEGVERVDVALTGETANVVASAFGYPGDDGVAEITIRLPSKGETYLISAVGALAPDAPRQPAERLNERGERVVTSLIAYHVKAE